ncbi:LysR family transcriptional regulator [Oharaeibacter diazotrophicus]|uniref:LysR family transcriptional regulator n=1 Tax=Oharaeibacter diazotrophicus TaxID=1920512 RepID=A0A4R6RIA1_9HYPH|nr:LysR family transcriptional regulator [Oharaeibacter diazotrophicus]TDP86173.1 LysR family transcriptional regulator [Oharaeibacter diazotrophicus]BBE71886.1 HTH-type transcriptional regulator DmlR [Pleomorphomonas sp. SM30]GLS78651.1 LysR family transcriptional regulator [Oharaeibacter diazotrophicus]
MRKPGLSDLDAALALARRASFRAAATDLGVSTTTLSNTIAKLEAGLGVRLFNRTTRSVSLTDAGRTFVGRIAPALREIEGAMDGARAEQAEPTGTLRINAFATAARGILEPLVFAFLRAHPRVHVEIVTEERLVDIVAEGFDVGVRAADLVPADMIALPLGPPLAHAVVASPAYLARHGRPRTPADLADHACIRVRLPNGALLRWPFSRYGETLQVDVTGPLTLDEAGLARAAVVEGFGIGFFQEPNVREEIAAGRLERILADWTPPLVPLCLYYPGRRNHSAALRSFLALAREIGKGAAP